MADFRSGVLSSLVSAEIEQAPERVRTFVDDYEDIAPNWWTRTKKHSGYAERYLAAGIVGPKWNADALHVAVATVSDCRVIVELGTSNTLSIFKKSRYTMGSTRAWDMPPDCDPFARGRSPRMKNKSLRLRGNEAARRLNTSTTSSKT